jgi:hypothetical protein
MRWAIVILAVCMSVTGCRSGKKGKKKELTDQAVVTPVRAYTGAIVLVNPTLRYVVVEGMIGDLPPKGIPLEVYRGENKVGDLTVSEQRRDMNFAADIVNGLIQVGDTIRSQVQSVPDEEK